MCDAIAATPPDPFKGTHYEGSPDGWWTEHAGALDISSGVVFIPQGANLPPCPFPCDHCRRKGRSDDQSDG